MRRRRHLYILAHVSRKFPSAAQMCATARAFPLPFWPHLQNSSVWRQQILNSIQRKSKLGREEIQPVTISVSMAFRGLAPLSPWKRISRCTTLTFSLPSHRYPSSSSDVLTSSQLSPVLPLLQRRYPCTLSARSSALFDYLDVVLPVPDVDNLIVLGSHLAKKWNKR